MEFTNKNENKSNKSDARRYEITSWEDEKLNLKDDLLRGIYAYGFEQPSSIQKKAIYPFIYGRSNKKMDIIAQAQSGTGKTGTFVVGALQLLNEKNKVPQVLILAPTHELARQIICVVDQLGHYLNIKSLLLVGGVSIDENKKDLNDNNPQIIVGTPGRVQDMIRRGYLQTKYLKLLVLDEADEMLSSGFKEQMGKILQFMPETIQIGLFSATLSEELLEISKTFMENPIKILVKNNCKTIYWKTGHSHIKRKVNLENALAGFEKSGHFFFNQPLGFGYDDGINSAIQVCHLLDNQNKKMSKIINELPKTYQTPTMAPYCKDEEKYKVVDDMVKKIQQLKSENTKIENQSISEVLTVNGIRFSLEDGSWGLIRASSNKPSLVIVTESPTSDAIKKSIFNFIDDLLQKTGKIGEYDQKI